MRSSRDTWGQNLERDSSSLFPIACTRASSLSPLPMHLGHEQGAHDRGQSRQVPRRPWPQLQGQLHQAPQGGRALLQWPRAAQHRQRASQYQRLVPVEAEGRALGAVEGCVFRGEGGWEGALPAPLPPSGAANGGVLEVLGVPGGWLTSPAVLTSSNGHGEV